MKRFLALLTTLLLVFSLFPVSALAQGEASETSDPLAVEETATPDPTETPVETPTPVVEVTPDPAETDALIADTPEPEAIFINLLGCDKLDSDGTGYCKLPCKAGEELSIKLTSESNAVLSYRWQMLDATSSAEDPYVDIDIHENATADKQTLVLTPDEALLGVADSIRCVVTATFGEQTLETACYYTLESALPELDLLPQGEMGTMGDGEAYFAATEAGLLFALNNGFTTIYTDSDFSISDHILIPSGVEFIVISGRTLTIQNGASLTNLSYFGANGSGVINVEGTLNNMGSMQIGIGSTLNILSGGSYVEGSENAQLSLKDGGARADYVSTINGIPNSQIDYEAEVNSDADLSFAVSRAEAGYRSSTFQVYKDATLTDNAEFSSDTTVLVYKTLTINAGVTLTLNGTIELQGGKLVNNGTIVNNGRLAGSGIFSNNGTLSGDGQNDMFAPVSDEAQLRDAIDQSAVSISLNRDIRLSDNLTVPAGTRISIYQATLTVPTGFVLENSGSISCDEIGARMVIEGTFSNAGACWCWNGGEIAFQNGGTYSATSDRAGLEISDKSASVHGAINGVDASNIGYNCAISTAEDFATAMGHANPAYRYNNFHFENAYTFSTNTEIPENYSFWTNYDITVAEDVTLTNNGFIETVSPSIFTNRGTIINEGTLKIGGTFVNEGTVSGSGDLQVNATVYTEAELRTALDNGITSINILGSFTLAENLEFPRNYNVRIDGATLTIPVGVTLQSSAWLDIFSDGKIVVESGGTLINSEGIMVNDGTLTVEAGGVYIRDESHGNGNLYEQFMAGATITGINIGYIVKRIDAQSESDIRTALALSGMGYRAVEIHQQQDITLQEDLTLENDIWYFMDAEQGVVLEVPSGKTLTNNAYLDIREGSELLIDAGATFANYGMLSINGTYTNNGTYIGDGEIQNGNRSVTTWEELKSAVEDNVSMIFIDGDITLQEDIAIAGGMKFHLDRDPVATLSVPSGVTLTLDPECEFYIDGGSLEVLSGGTLVNNGWLNMDAGSVNMHEGSTFYDNASVDLVGDAVGIFDGTYIPGNEHWFWYTDSEGSATISGIDLENVFYRVNVESIDDINTYAAKFSAEYRNFFLFLNDDLTLPADFELAAGVILEVCDDHTLTISAGNSATIYGSLRIDSEATLEIQAGATLNIADDGYLNLEGTRIGEGEIIGNYDYTAFIRSDEELRAAEANGAKHYQVVGSFTLEDDFTLPGGVMMTIENATLTVPSGMTFQSNSFMEIRGGTLLIESGAALDNRDGLWIYNNAGTNGVLEISSGAQYIAGMDSWVAIEYDHGEVHGLAMEKVGISVPVRSEEELKDALLYDLTGYRDATVSVMEPITLNSDAKVPAWLILEIGVDEDHAGMDGLTIAANATLTNAGQVRVQRNNTLVIEGTLANVESGTLEIIGELVNHGEVTYEGDSSAHLYVKTEDDLIAAVELGASIISYEGDITLTNELVIPSKTVLETSAGGSLTIGDGGKLTLDTTVIRLYDGSLEVAEGGELILSNHSYLSLWLNGSLVVKGDMTILGKDAKIYLREDNTATISGITEENCAFVYAYKNVFSLEEMKDALSYYKDSPYADNIVYPCVDLSCSEDITVPNSVTLDICDGVTFTVPEDKLLTIAQGGKLQVETTGSLVVAGTLENFGKVEFAPDNVSITGTYTDHTGATSYVIQATSMAKLKAALTLSQRPMKINCAGFTIDSNITIPSGVTVMFDFESTATIAKGATVTVNANGAFGTRGMLENKGAIVNNGKFSVEWGGILTNTGSLTNNAMANIYGGFKNHSTVTVAENCKVRFFEGSILGGLNAVGSWFITEGVKVTELAIVGADTIGIGEQNEEDYAVTALPTDAWSTEVTWSITDGAEVATIDASTGALQGTAEGSVTICATATDGSDVTAEKTISIRDYSIAITGQDWVLAGKTLQLTAGFVPANPTGTTVAWSMAAEDSAYASVSATGLLTAKPVTEQHVVTVIAASADGKTKAAEKQITIYPLASAVKILQDSNDVTGQTLTLNSNTSDTLTLSGQLYPTDAKSGITWSLSATDAASIEAGADGESVTITPIAGKTKLITLTAKADNGVGISAIVKIQITAQSNGVTVSGVTGGTLMAGKSAQLIATFTDPQPTNRAVKWVLSPEYEAYATLSAAGLLTAKLVTDEVTIKVVALPLDGGAASDEYEVKLQPLATAVVIKWGADYVTGTTLSLDMARETTLALTALTWPDAAEDAVTWSSSAPAIASVDNAGNITAKSAGTATITVRAEDGSGVSAIVKLTIKSLPQEIEANAPVLSLRGGVGATYTAINKSDPASSVLPASMVRWTLAEGNAAYASITTAGVLKTTSVPCEQTIKLRVEVIGNETIAYDEIEVKIYPAVQSMAITSEGATVSGTTLTINAPLGADKTDPESITLNALPLPLDSQQSVTWTSSNTKVAQVTDGVVTPVRSGSAYVKGTATITAKATDGSGKSATVTILVVEGVKSISFNVAEGTTLESKKTLQLKATADNATATNKKIALRIIEGGEYALLSASGLLTAKTVYEDRTVVVEANSADGCATKKLTLTILAHDNPVEIYNWAETENYSGTWKQIDANLPEYASLRDIQLELLAKEESASGKAITWNVTPSSVAKVVSTPSGMLLQALTTGVAVVTAKTSDGRSATFTVEIYRGATALTIAPPIGLDAGNLTLASGKTMQLTSKFAPATGITTKGVVWTLVEEGASLNNPVLANDYATISANGLVTARTNLTEPKEITVRAYSKNAPYLTSSTDLTIQIQPIVTGLEIVQGETILTNTTYRMNLTDTTMQLGSAAYPANASQNVVWTSSSKAIATVSSTGLVTALKSGSVTITAKSSDGSGKSASVKLMIAAGVDTLEITSSKGFEMRSGATLQLGVAFSPSSPTDKRVTWSLAPEDALLAKINTAGLVTAKTLTHSATIHVIATSVDNPSATSTKEITICPATTKVLILDALTNDVTGQTLTLDLNGTEPMQLAAQNLPTSTGGAIQGVTWKSSNTSVLKVTDGLLEPVLNAKTGKYNTGTVSITATATDGSGKSASLKVNVQYLVTGISFASDLTLKAGKTLTLKPIFAPLNATNKTVKWSIDAGDIAYATISSAGVLTAKKVTSEKTITIICAAQDGSGITQTVTVKIIP